MTLNQIIKRRMIYTFQHAIFYDTDLEWLPDGTGGVTLVIPGVALSGA